MKRLQLHAQGLVHAQRLPDAQIQHDFLAATGDGIGSDISIQPLDLGTLAATAITQTAKDLTGLAGAEFKRRRRLSFQTGNGASEFQHGFDFVHLLALVDHVFEPGVRGFDLAEHVGELEADDGVLD